MADQDVTFASVPRAALVPLVHGYLQRIADDVGVELLHVKGPSVDPRLRRVDDHGDPVIRLSMDVDVLVHPNHVETLRAELIRRDWSVLLDFETASAFAHAANLGHDHLGDLDLHRAWPGIGIDPVVAFEQLWSRRSTIQIANVQCAVPDLGSQRLLMLMHSGRSGGPRHADVEPLWNNASVKERTEVRRLAVQFDGEVALAAGIGELEAYRRHPDYLIWRHFSQDSQGRWDEWAGRWRSARGVGPKARVLRKFVSVNPDRLRMRVGSDPTAFDYAVEFALRARAAFRDLTRSLSDKLRRSE